MAHEMSYITTYSVALSHCNVIIAIRQCGSAPVDIDRRKTFKYMIVIR